MTKTSNFDYKNLTKTQQQCLGLIESLGIYELRALARVFGDNSPTTLKRNDHINIVMTKIISGDELQPIPLRQGRPYKELSNIEGILVELSQITGKDYTLKSTQPRPIAPVMVPKAVVFNQLEEDIVNKKMFPIETKGVLCERNDKELYFINQDNGKLVLVKKENRLKPNDFITGTAVIMNEEKEYVLDTLKTINYQPVTAYHEIIDEYYNEVPSKKIKFNSNDILLGSRYIYNGKFKDNAEIKELITSLKDERVVTIGVFTNVLYENVLEIKNLGLNNAFILKYDDQPLKIYQTFTALLNHIERIQHLGMSVALFIDDMTTIINAIDYANSNSAKNYMNHCEDTINIIKRFVMLAKAGINGKHTTLFTAYDETDLFDQLFASAVYKVSKKII